MSVGNQRLEMCYTIQRKLDDGTPEGWDRLRKWWATPNPLLGGAIPEKLKDAGPDGEDELHRMVMNGLLP
jgi:hypothetical protein